MKSAKLSMAILAVIPYLVFQGCGGGGGSSSSSNNGGGGGGGGGTGAANVMTVSVDGSLCSDATSSGYFNKPCVSVTVCDANNCQTVNDVLLDTGSYGLRVFKSAIPNLSLPQIASGSGALAGCVEFADGSLLWGPIKMASVKLGNEPAVNIPIQVIDSAFASPAGTNCAVTSTSPYAGPHRTPAEAGFTAILGMGVATYDCGEACVNNALGVYFRCTGSTCVPTTAPLSTQVRNPATALPVDNNGLILQLPTVPLTGLPSTTGTLLLGIGTQTNNPSGTPHVFPTDSTGNFITVFNGTTFSEGFLDTGSNSIFIPPTAVPATMPRCTGNDSDWYCPNTSTAILFTAINKGLNGTPSIPVNFYVGNATRLFNTNNNVFNDIAGAANFGFDWGLPFFFGRKVLYGFEGKRTPSLGASGPFVAY